MIESLKVGQRVAVICNAVDGVSTGVVLSSSGKYGGSAVVQPDDSFCEMLVGWSALYDAAALRTQAQELIAAAEKLEQEET